MARVAAHRGALQAHFRGRPGGHPAAIDPARIRTGTAWLGDRQLAQPAGHGGAHDLPEGHQPRRRLQHHAQPARLGFDQHRLRRGRERRAPGQPHPLSPAFPRAAHLFPGRLRGLQLRSAQQPAAVLLPAHRLERGPGDPDRVRHPPDRPGRQVRNRVLPDRNRKPRLHRFRGDRPGLHPRTVLGGPGQAAHLRAVDHRRDLYAARDGGRQSAARRVTGLSRRPAHGRCRPGLQHAQLPRQQELRSRGLLRLEFESRSDRGAHQHGSFGARHPAQLPQRHLVGAHFLPAVRRRLQPGRRLRATQRLPPGRAPHRLVAQAVLHRLDPEPELLRAVPAPGGAGHPNRRGARVGSEPAGRPVRERGRLQRHREAHLRIPRLRIRDRGRGRHPGRRLYQLGVCDTRQHGRPAPGLRLRRDHDRRFLGWGPDPLRRKGFVPPQPGHQHLDQHRVQRRAPADRRLHHQPLRAGDRVESEPVGEPDQPAPVRQPQRDHRSVRAPALDHRARERRLPGLHAQLARLFDVRRGCRVRFD